MGEVQTAGNGGTAVLRWVARLVAVVAAALFVWFLVESGARVLSGLGWGDVQGVPLFAAVAVAVAGVLIAWRWELVGGVLAVVGALAIVVLVVAGSGLDMVYAALLFAAPLLVAGAFYLGCCARRRAAGGRR